MGLRRWERRVRSRILGSPFVITNLLTRYEIMGEENLEAALDARRRGAGIISISNHLSLFDDPFILVKLLGIKNLTVESKCWWSTPCESNFMPRGKGLGPWFVRYFSDVSNMVFFARAKKVGAGITLPSAYAPALNERAGSELMDRLETMAAQLGFDDSEGFLKQYLTQGDHEKLAFLNQPGMVEACARVELGDWLHFFPEGGRSKSLHLKPPRRGVGKVIFHNPEAIVLPICFYGSQDVLPVQGLLPRPFKKVVVSIGKPIEARKLIASHNGAPDPGLFKAISMRAWENVTTLRPMTLARYLGPAKASALLRAEAPASQVFAGETMGQPTESSRPEELIRARRDGQTDISRR